MKKSYYYEPIVTPIANNGSSKFGFIAKTVSFNDSLNTRFEVEISGKTIEELKQKTDDFFRDSIQLKCEYYLCSKSVVDLFKPFEVSKPFKSGYAEDEEYFVAWLHFDEVNRYYQANEEKILKQKEDFFARECTQGPFNVSFLKLNRMKKNGLLSEIKAELSITSNKNISRIIYNLSEREKCTPVEFINKIV
jgi:CRISPR/Cas system CMR-associated protein Cmr1 (group 7 of RAMP superfamily)